MISAMPPIQSQSHKGTESVGSSFHRQTATNTKSAAVSSFAPNSLAVLVLRATAPSIMSVRPATRYMTRNDGERG